MKNFSEQQYLKTGFSFILSAAEITCYECCSSILFLTPILFSFVFGQLVNECETKKENSSQG